MAIPLIMLAQACIGDADIEGSPIQITMVEDFASFTHADHADNRIGYRFHEHTPLTYGEAPESDAASREATVAAEALAARYAKRPGALAYRRCVVEEGWIPQTWMFYLVPVRDGVDMLLLVETEDVGLPEYHGIQQCFRLGGVTNSEWRQKYARTPAFSEYDIWKAQGNEESNLTWVLRAGVLEPLPGCKETVGYRTSIGERMDRLMNGGNLEGMTHVGPYKARMLGTVDGGVIWRSSQDGAWSCGVYWERTTHVTNHHPADCLHAIVNTGGVAPHAKRAVAGKIYWLKGDGAEVVRHLTQDFPCSE